MDAASPPRESLCDLPSEIPLRRNQNTLSCPSQALGFPLAPVLSSPSWHGHLLVKAASFLSDCSSSSPLPVNPCINLHDWTISSYHATDVWYLGALMTGLCGESGGGPPWRRILCNLCSSHGAVLISWCCACSVSHWFPNGLLRACLQPSKLPCSMESASLTNVTWFWNWIAWLLIWMYWDDDVLK